MVQNPLEALDGFDSFQLVLYKSLVVYKTSRHCGKISQGNSKLSIHPTGPINSPRLREKLLGGPFAPSYKIQLLATGSYILDD